MNESTIKPHNPSPPLIGMLIGVKVAMADTKYITAIRSKGNKKWASGSANKGYFFL